LADYRQALAIDPDDAYTLNFLASFYAACPDKRYRDTKRAVENANKAYQLTQGKYWLNLDTLAAAYAAEGDMKKATEWEARAIELAPDEERKQLCRSHLVVLEVARVLSRWAH
jgi:tetratricopeptide (TPR) repeat protein